MFCMLLSRSPQGFTVHLFDISHTKYTVFCMFLADTTQRNLLCICMFSLHHPQGFTLRFACFPHTTHRDLPYILHVSSSHAQRVTVYFVSLHVSPTPSTGTYCVICMFLSRSLHGFTAYFVYFSYTSHRDLLCILHASPTPPTGILCIQYLYKNSGNLEISLAPQLHSITICVNCKFSKMVK